MIAKTVNSFDTYPTKTTHQVHIEILDEKNGYVFT